MPVSLASDKNKMLLPEREGLTAVDDGELDLVAGGQDYVFRGEGFQRDSWFVSFMTKRLIQGSLRQELARPLDAVPQEISVEGRRYRVWQLSGTTYVEEV